MTVLPDASSKSSFVATGVHRGARWYRLCLKELRETLRDRRTLITLILMPLLVYPILSMVFQRSLLSAWSSNRDRRMLIGVISEETADFLKGNLLVSDTYLRRERGVTSPNPEPERGEQQDAKFSLENLLPGEFEVDDIRFQEHEDLEDQVRAEKIDIGILSPRESKSGRFELIYRDTSALSQRALKFVEQRMLAMNEIILRKRLRELGGSPRLMFRPLRQPIQVAAKDMTLSTIVPMILVLMTVTGAVYPAIDLTAGERERGTLEMLMASPVSRLKLLLAKYVAVVTVACLTALVNLTGMTVTLAATGLSRVLFGDGGLGLARVVEILALLLLFASFFSAVLLALTSFARSFKEAQAYLIPLMLLSLGPGVVSLLPGLQLGGLLAITPVSNIVLLARDVCTEEVNPLMATVAVLSTGIYTLAAIGIAAKIFGADAVMNGGQAGIRSLFSPSANGDGVSSVSGALLCLAILFPIYFVTANSLGQLRGIAIPVRLAVSAAATSVLFGVIPWIAARLQRLDVRKAFQLRPAPAAAFTVAMMLGFTVWPIAHEIIVFTEAIGFSSIDTEQFKLATRLLTDLRTVPPALFLLSMALTPAVFEELFFRGYMFSALRKVTTRRTTILVSALLFGLFHVVLNGALSVERLFPSTFMGLVLGWLCFRSGSVLPGILLHACHNGFLLMLGYYKDDLIAMGLGVEEQTHLPLSWIAISLGCLLLGVVLIALLPRAQLE